MPVYNVTTFGAGTYQNSVRKYGRIQDAAASSAIIWDGSDGYDGLLWHALVSQKAYTGV